MSAQTIAFPSDVSNVRLNENLVLLGLQDGSVSYISTAVIYHQTLNIENYHL